LCPLKGIEIAAEVLHVDVQVRDRLCPIHHGDDAALLRFSDQRLHRVDRAQRIAHVADRQDAGAIVEQLVRIQICAFAA
jgi:hypothetical protein